MNSQISRGLRGHGVGHLISSGPGAIESLLYKLNAGCEAKDTIRIREMVRDMNEIDRIVRSKGYPTIVKERFGGTINDLGMNLEEELDKLGFEKSVLATMTRIRETYESFDCTLRPVFPLQRGWHFSWMHPHESKLQGVVWLFLSIIHDLAQEGRLRRVRQCDICHRWFFAHRPDPRFRFCKRACREKHWRASPQGKAKRAVFMRKYRRRLKERDRENLRASKRPEKRK